MKSPISKRLAFIVGGLLVLVIGAGLMQRNKEAVPPAPSLAEASPPLPATNPVSSAVPAAEPSKAQAPALTAASPAVAAEAAKAIYLPVGGTTGQPLEPKSAAFVQAQLEGRKLAGRVTTLDLGTFSAIFQVSQGDHVSIPLTDSKAVEGVVNLKLAEKDGLVSIGGSLAENAGSFAFEVRGKEVRGLVQLPPQGLAYRLEQDPAGAVLLREVLLTDVVCAQAVEEGGGGAPAPSDNLTPTPPPVLNSRPTATAQVYLDFDGETVTDPYWNAGTTIEALPPDLTEQQMTDIFNQVKEDFLPFNINITTELSRYNAAPVGLRMHCVITPTNTASNYAPGTLGVAFVGVFKSTLRTVPCWAFTHDVSTYGIGGVGVSLSHEIGHTLGLTHDGVSTVAGDNYFGGHGQGRRTFTAPPPYVNEANNRYARHWGPIMGSPMSSFGIGFGPPLGLVQQRDLVDVAQWSKGEYQNANNSEDDIAVIASSENGFGYAVDEAGGGITFAAALQVAGTTVNQGGTITQASDTDVFSFTTTGGAVSISTGLGDPSPNLDVALEILNASGAVVASANPAASLTATLSTTLTAGSYYLKVSSSGDGNALTDGYTTYGSIGAYALKGTITGFVPTPEIALEQPAGTIRTSGSTRDFGGVIPGTSSTLVFTVKNTGTQQLTISSVGVTGADFASFSVSTGGMVTSLGAPTGETTFSVTFAPQALGSFQTTLRIQSDDLDEGAYDILLTGTGTAASTTDTTQAHFVAGAATTLDLTTTPGDVILARVNQQNSAGITGAGFGFNAAFWMGQTFVPSVTGPLSRVDVALFAAGLTGTTPDIVVSLRATTGSPAVPTGPDLATATIAGFSTGFYSDHTAVFATPATVTAGTTYAVVFRPVTNPSVGQYAYVYTAGPDTNPYPAGQRVTSGVNGTTWEADTVAGGRDLAFKIYVGSPYPASGDLVSAVKDSTPGAGFATQWTSLSWTATTPTGTSIKFQVAGSASPTGPFAFIGPDGTDSSYFTTSGTSLSQFRGFRYLKYHAFLATTDLAVTPVLSDVSLNYYHVYLSAPVLATTPTSSGVAASTAVLGGTVTSDGNATLTACGIVLAQTSVNANPQLGGTGVVTIPHASATVGAFTDGVGSLLSGTAYTFAAYATNAQGTSYSSPASFTTLAVSANLAGLSLGGATLSPAFDSGTTSYSASVSNATSTITFSATAEDGSASISAPSSPFSLNPGANTLALVVTAAGGAPTKTYTVTITRRLVAEDALNQWAVDRGLAPGVAGSNADSDGDGIPNLLEFAFGTNPSTGSNAPLQLDGTFAGGGTITATGQPAVDFEPSATGTDYRAIFVQRKDHAAIGLTYTVRFSADMTIWQTSAVTPSVLADDGTHQIVSVPYPFFIGGKKARFFQVVVTPAP